MLFSFKRNIAAIFVIGSLLSMSTAHAGFDVKQLNNPRLAAALAAAGATYYLVGHHEQSDSSNPVNKVLNVASKVASFPSKFYAQKKDALHSAAAVGALIYYRHNALNSINDALFYFATKAPGIFAFYTSPK